MSAFQNYVQLILQLRGVSNDSPEADVIREKMGEHWHNLTQSEISLVREVGEALSSPKAWESQPTGHGAFDFADKNPPPHLVLRCGKTSVAFAIPVKWQPGDGRGETFSSTSGRLDWETQILASMADEVAAWVDQRQIFRKMFAVMSGLPPGASVSGDLIDWGDGEKHE